MYGFIPERVSVITSVTVGSNKEFTTPIGTFSYHHLSKSRYSIGIDHKEIEGQIGGFLIATPEKALVDWVFCTSKDMNEKELLQDLLEGRRIEEESLQSLDKEMLSKISQKYKSEIVRKLHNIIRKL